MTRLNKEIKESIIANAIAKAGINEREERLKNWRADWAEKVRLEAIGGEGVDKKVQSIKNRFAKAVSELPKGILSGNSLFDDRACIYVNVAGCRFNAFFNGEIVRRSFKANVYKVSPYDYVLKQGHKLATEFNKIDEEQRSINSEREKIGANVAGALSTVSTVKKLLEVWPECKELLPKDLPSSKANLPAVQVKELNKIIGLPSDKSE